MNSSKGSHIVSEGEGVEGGDLGDDGTGSIEEFIK